jgi:sortase A
VDFHLWSPGRITAYRASLTSKMDAPIALLRIPKIHLEVPVFDGTDDLALDRGVGRVLGTAKIGQAGNIGIAGHRDGFFRGLQDIAEGDRIELILPEHDDRYTVEQTEVVLPDDVSVLTQTANRTLTLITCYPFYFVGHAPKRYIVSAVLESSEGAALNGDREANYGYERSTDKNKEKQK